MIIMILKNNKNEKTCEKHVRFFLELKTFLFCLPFLCLCSPINKGKEMIPRKNGTWEMEVSWTMVVYQMPFVEALNALLPLGPKRVESVCWLGQIFLG